MSDQEVGARDSSTSVSSQEDDSIDINDEASQTDHPQKTPSVDISAEASKDDSESMKTRQSQRLLDKREAENSKGEEQGITESQNLTPCRGAVN